LSERRDMPFPMSRCAPLHCRAPSLQPSQFLQLRRFASIRVHSRFSFILTVMVSLAPPRTDERCRQGRVLSLGAGLPAIPIAAKAAPTRDRKHSSFILSVGFLYRCGERRVSCFKKRMVRARVARSFDQSSRRRASSSSAETTPVVSVPASTMSARAFFSLWSFTTFSSMVPEVIMR